MSSKLSDDDIRNILKGKFPNPSFRLEDLQTTELRKLAKFMGQELKIKDIKSLSRENLLTEIRRVRPNIDKKIEEGDTGVALPAGAKKLEDLNTLALRKLISKYNKDIVIRNYQTLGKAELISEIRKRVPMLEFKPEVQAPLRTALEPKPEVIEPELPKFSEEELERGEAIKDELARVRPTGKKAVRYMDIARALKEFAGTKYDVEGENYKDLMKRNDTTFNIDELGDTEQLPSIASLGKSFKATYDLEDYKTDNKILSDIFLTRVERFREREKEDFSRTVPLTSDEIIKGTLKSFNPKEYGGENKFFSYIGEYKGEDYHRGNRYEIKEGKRYPKPYHAVRPYDIPIYGDENIITYLNYRARDYLEREAKGKGLLYKIVVGQRGDNPFPIALGRVYERVNDEISVFYGLNEYPEIETTEVEAIQPSQQYSEDARKFINLALEKGDGRVHFVNPFNRNVLSDTKYMVFNREGKAKKESDFKKSYIYVLLAKGKGKVHIKGFDGGLYEIEYQQPYYPNKVENIIRPSDIRKVQDFDDVNEYLTNLFQKPWKQAFKDLQFQIPKIYNFKQDWLKERGKDFWGSDLTRDAWDESLGGYGLTMMLYQNELRKDEGLYFQQKLFYTESKGIQLIDLKRRYHQPLGMSRLNELGRHKTKYFIKFGPAGYELNLVKNKTERVAGTYDDTFISGMKNLVDMDSYYTDYNDENYRTGSYDDGVGMYKFKGDKIFTTLKEYIEHQKEFPERAVDNNWERVVKMAKKVEEFNDTESAKELMIERKPPEFGLSANHPNPNIREKRPEELKYRAPPPRTPSPPPKEPTPEPVEVDIETGRGLTPETDDDEILSGGEEVELVDDEFRTIKGQTIPVWRIANQMKGDWWRRTAGNTEDPGEDIEDSSDKIGSFEKKANKDGKNWDITYYEETYNVLGTLRKRKKLGTGSAERGDI